MGELADDWAWDEEHWEIVCEGATPFEFDFFARDLDGRVGMFSTYNSGPIPWVVLESRERYNRLLLTIVARRPSGGVIVEVDYGGDFEEHARRGLYTYDNGAVHHPQQPAYERIVCPTMPMTVEQLGLDAEVARSLPLLEARFASEDTIGFDRIHPALTRRAK